MLQHAPSASWCYAPRRQKAASVECVRTVRALLRRVRGGVCVRRCDAQVRVCSERAGAAMLIFDAATSTMIYAMSRLLAATY